MLMTALQLNALKRLKGFTDMEFNLRLMTSYVASFSSEKSLKKVETFHEQAHDLLIMSQKALTMTYF